MLAYFDITADTRQLQAGDLLLLRGKVREVQAPLNPHQFDYKAYLSYRGVYHQAFVEEWQRIGHRGSLISTAAQLRQQCVNVLRQHLPTVDEFSVGAALILGYKAELSEAVEEAYANTGAMHVLAVSGLHVGLVQLLLMALLGKLPFKGRWWRYGRTLIILLGIWGFALITGASPSVLRAATMFSFLAVGQAFERSTNIYNTLAASAFLLLCFNPMLLYHVGFQLSYLAVLGIVYFQPRIYNLWYIQNPAGDYLWKLAAVSLAAQIGTLPISLYYFHQFPIYFLLSGLVVVPAAGFVLGSGLLLFAVQSVPFLAGVLGKVLYYLLYAVNACIFALEQLPGSLLGGIWIGLGVVLLLYVILACSILAHRTHNFRWVLVALFLTVVLAGSHAWRQWRIITQRGVTVYHLYKNTAIDHFAGRSGIALQPSELEADRFAFAAEQHRWWRGSHFSNTYAPQENIEAAPQRFGQSGFWWLSGHKLLVLSNEDQLRGVGAPAQGAIVLSQGPRLGIGELVERVPTKLVIADGSTPPWLAERWAAEAEAAGVRFWYTAWEGAWVWE
jgi:competence protein ComEC